MARRIKTRIKVTGTMVAATPLHVGSIGSDPTVDLSLAVDGRNRFYIPGTGIAGAFRNWMEADGIDVDFIWGYQKENQGHASYITIEDALVTLPENAIAELRDHVGINRVLGSASDKTKFDRAILPKGSSFQLKMTIDVRQDSPIALDGIEQLMDALQKDGLRLGAAKTRGLGLVKMLRPEWMEYDFGSFAGMVKTLKKSGTPYQPTAVSNSSLLRLSIHWQPTGAMMVKSGQDGVMVDILPLVSRDREHLAFVLPGSGVKGAVRSQAERILRTVLRLDANSNDVLQTQIEDPSLDLAHWLFGKSGTGDSTEQVSFGRGALTVDDCFCEKKLDPVRWRSVEQAADDPLNDSGTLRKSLDAAGLTETQQAFHVAIDRWTGGAADQMLYSALEPFNLAWEPIELSLDLRRIEESQRGAVQALLWLTLRDLALGRIPLGYGVNRGYGSLKVEKIMVGDQAVTISPQGMIDGMDVTELEQAWQSWLAQAGQRTGEEVAK